MIGETDELHPIKNLKNAKTKLLGINQNLTDGFYYWTSFVRYMRKIIYTSEETMSTSNHPCRNKICHGDQVNYGTQEHALKSILIIDSLIKNAEASKEYLERKSNNMVEANNG